MRRRPRRLMLQNGQIILAVEQRGSRLCEARGTVLKRVFALAVKKRRARAEFKQSATRPISIAFQVWRVQIGLIADRGQTRP